MTKSKIGLIIFLTVLACFCLFMTIGLILGDKALGASLFSAMTVASIWGIDDTINN
jgi:hypothetical protein